LIEFLEEAENCSGCNRIRMDLLPKYEVHPTYTITDYVVHTLKNDVVQFKGYFCPFPCYDMSI